MSYTSLITKNANKGLIQGDATTGAMRFSIDGGQTWKEISANTFTGVTDISYLNGVWTITYSDSTTEDINVGVDNFLSSASFDAETNVLTLTMVNEDTVTVDLTTLISSKVDKVTATADTILTADGSQGIKATSKVFGGASFNATPNTSTIPSESSIASYIASILSDYITETDLSSTLGSFATDEELSTGLSGKVDKDGTKVLSDNNYDSTSKSKLDNLVNITTIGANLSLADGTLSATVSGGSSITWHIIDTNTTASANHGYMIDASSRAVELTLPSSFTLGDTIPVRVLDKTNTITLKRNGNKIEGLDEDLTVDIDKSGFYLTASDATHGWIVTTEIPGGSDSKIFATCNGRLTLTTNVPVTTADVTSATTIYFTPYNGSQIALYDGASWSVYVFSELSLSLSGLTANTNYDVFIYNNSGTLTLESVAWTDGTTRATALVLQDGIYVKSGATTRRYLGTFRTTATTGQCENSKQKRFVWNYYNQVLVTGWTYNSNASWTYSTGAWREFNNGTGQNRFEMVCGGVTTGQAHNGADATGASGSSAYLCMALDSTTSPFLVKKFVNTTGLLNIWGNPYIQLGAGYHYITMIEYSQAGVAYTNNGDYQSYVTIMA